MAPAGAGVPRTGQSSGNRTLPAAENGGILLTDQKFGDFELTIQMKPDWGICSGVFVRGNDQGKCLQMMVDYHDKGNIGHIYGEGTGGFNNRPFDINGLYDANQELIGFTSQSLGHPFLPGLYDHPRELDQILEEE